MIDTKSSALDQAPANRGGHIRLPNFLVLGPPRTATTWLFRCLDGHPEVFIPNIKEARFFDERYEQGFSWYQSLYESIPATIAAIGDITPGYFIAPAAPERIHDTLGDALKLFIIVRDPVERAYSHYKMLRRSGLVSDDFQEALKSHGELVENSLYTKHLERYLAYFPATALNLLDYNTLMVSPENYLLRFLHVLGVQVNQGKVIQERVNYAVSESVSPKLVRTTTALRQTIEQSKVGRTLLWWLRDAGVMQRWHLLTARKSAESHQLNKQQYAVIHQKYFADDFANLQKYRHHYIV